MKEGFELYQEKVIAQLKAAGFIGDAKEFASSLDMSYDDIKDLPPEKWDLHIKCDLADYKLDVPEDFK